MLTYCGTVQISEKFWFIIMQQWRGFGSGALGAGRLLQFLNNNNITHIYSYFGRNSSFKAITHQLKAFKISLNVPNWINEVQDLYVRINVTKYNVTFTTKREVFNHYTPMSCKPISKYQTHHSYLSRIFRLSRQ